RAREPRRARRHFGTPRMTRYMAAPIPNRLHVIVSHGVAPRRLSAHVPRRTKRTSVTANCTPRVEYRSHEFCACPSSFTIEAAAEALLFVPRGRRAASARTFERAGP